MPNIRVMHVGLGPIGAAILKQLAGRRGFKVVGGVDVDPAKVGRDLGDVAGLPQRLGVKVSTDIGKALKSTKPDVVVLCTSSSIKKVLPQIETILKSKTPIVTTTEELCVSRLHAHPAGAPDSCVGQEGEGGRARHRRQSRVRDGRAADRAHGRLRPRRSRRRQPHPGRARPPAAVPAEDRRRADHRAVPEAGATTAACGTSASPSRSR